MLPGFRLQTSRFALYHQLQGQNPALFIMAVRIRRFETYIEFPLSPRQLLVLGSNSIQILLFPMRLLTRLSKHVYQYQSTSTTRKPPHTTLNPLQAPTGGTSYLAYTSNSGKFPKIIRKIPPILNLMSISRLLIVLTLPNPQAKNSNRCLSLRYRRVKSLRFPIRRIG